MSEASRRPKPRIPPRARAPASIIAALALRAVALGKRELDAELARVPARSRRRGARSPRAPGTPRPLRRSIRRPSSPKRIARHMFSSIIRGAGSTNGTPSSTSRTACAMQATISEASASDSCAVACASQIRTSTVPKLKCGRTDHHTCVNSTIERVRIRKSMYSRYAGQPPNASGTPQRGKLLVKLCVRAECRPAVAPVEVWRVRRDRQQQRQHRAQAVADAHRAVDVADAQVHVQAERVVAPGDVFQPVLDAAVVLGVDDRLLAVVGPRVRAGRAERDALRARPARTGAGGARAGARARRAGRRRRRR